MAKYISIAAILAVCVCAVMLAPPPAQGQAVFGSILGTVSDPQGAAVANAKVTVINQRKNASETTTSNESGNYSVTHLIPDIYTVRVEAPGFKITEQKDVVVSVDTGSRVDLQFQVGGASETVEVTGEAPQLKTDRADVAVTFNDRYVSELPILNRNFTTLELLSPGTQKLVGWSHAATENPQGSQQIFVNGQHFSGTAYELDGTDNQDPILGIIVINPNLDSVTETKITQQNYSAEFGKAIAGVVTAQTKSGSNQIHGSGFYFWRGEGQQARDPFSQPVGTVFPSNKWKQFGGSVGGPIIKDKLFFFGDYQGTRRTVGTTAGATVPTQTALDTCIAAFGNPEAFCDLSDYAAIQPAGIYNPFSGDGTPGTRQLFTDYLIPGDLLSAAGVNILKKFPNPTSSDPKNNFDGSGSGPFDDNSFNTRIDYAATSSVNVFGRFSLAYYKLSGKGVLGYLGGVGLGQLGLDGSAITHNYSLSTGFTKTFSSSLLTDFRIGWFRYNPVTNKAEVGTNPADELGIPGLNLGDVTTSGLPAFIMDGGQTLSDFGGGLGPGRCNCPLTEKEQQIQFVNNWTKIFGNHQVKFGGDVRFATNLRVPSDKNRTGELHFSKLFTSNGGSGGLDLATLLLGGVTSFERYVSVSTNAQESQPRIFWYGQDTWRATSKLTLDFGLRWEWYFPESVNGKGRGGFANLTDGVIRVAGYGPYGNNGNINKTWKAFAPRLGVAYQVTPKTVVRLGYGRSFDIGVFGSIFGHTVTQNLPVLATQSLNATSQGNGQNDVFQAFIMDEGAPAFVFPTIPDNGQLPLRGPLNNVVPRIRPTFMKLPTLDAWNATVQRQITKTISLEAAYVGNKGTHVFVGNGPNYNSNPILLGPGFSVNGSFKNGAPGNIVDPNSLRPYYQAFTTNYQGEDIVCCDGDLYNTFNNIGNSIYNGLQLKVEKRFSEGLQLLAHYTYSKAYGYTDDGFIVNKKAAWGRDDFNRDQVFVANFVYDLPFGKGKRFGGGASRGVDALFGGWQLTGTVNKSSGLPWTPSYNECGEDKNTGPCRPDVSGSFHSGVGATSYTGDGRKRVAFFTPTDPWIYPQDGQDFCTETRLSGGGFSRPACSTIGNVKRNSLTGPAFFGTDASIVKNFHFNERYVAQFRMDAFNLFNHPVYGFNSQQGNKCIDCGGDAGQITSLENGTTMRQLQFAVRFTF